MSRKFFKVIVPILVMIEFCSVFLAFNSYKNRKLDAVKEESIVERKRFAMYISNGTGEYEEYTTSDIFPNSLKYVFNSEKSNCIDNYGNIVNNIMTYENDKITITSNKSVYCYLYFDKKTITDCTGDLGNCLLNTPTTGLNTTMEGGLYRYQGTSANNYICFGTSDKATCTGNTDAYMYRIMGINSSGQLKLIKNEALNSEDEWYSNYTTNITWPQSTVYSNINGSTFLTNSTYMPSGWSDKIATTTWKYGDNTTDNTTAANLYSIENGWTSTTSAKIGLMYMHDYYYGMPGGNNCSSSGAYTTCKTSWLFLENCDSGAPSSHEWTMSRYGYKSRRYLAWYVNSDGYAKTHFLTTTNAVRPVFYLNADEVYVSGSGTADDPIMLSEPPTLGEYLLSNPTTGLNSTMEGGLYRYQGTSANNYICFGTSDKSTCTGNTDAYMYRIMGINSSGQLKLIKNEALNSTDKWYSNYTTNITWPQSTVYSNINGSTFLTNSTYMPSGWSSKIATTTWKYGDNTTYNTTAASLYSTENGWTSTTSAKIGLMYMHDYYYGMSGGNNCSSSGAYTTCKTSWLFLGNCDSGAPSSYEWTMSRYGLFGSTYTAWGVNSGGYVALPNLTNTYAVRPVFYLNADELYVSGSGTADDPIMLSEPEVQTIGEYLLSNPTTGLNTTMEGGLYRYQGTSANNYICFGTSDKSTCTGNTDAYMYRIIGINSSNQLKLIKNEALNSTDKWYSDSATDITWPQSTVYSNINGSTFLTNSTYMPSGWSDKIATTTWKYGDNTTDNTTAASLYSTENGWTSTTSAKIGLMYMHDYYYGLSGGTNCSYSGGLYSTCKTSWLFLGNCDSGAPSVNEWTMSRFGFNGNYYGAVYVHSNGYASFNPLSVTYAVRPVFYLTSDVQFLSGTGTSSDPFIIN